jgi:hypothetical protein
MSHDSAYAVHRSTVRSLWVTALVLLTLRSAAPACVGDCEMDGRVTVTELITMVDVALGSAAVSACMPGDADNDGTIRVHEIVLGVNSFSNDCPASASPTPTPTSGTAQYVGDYHGTSSDGAIGVRFHVNANGSASGFLDFLGGGAAAAVAGEGGGAAVLFSVPVSGQAHLTTGTYQLNGTNAGSPFTISGELANGATAGTFSVSLFGMTYAGPLLAGMGEPTATPTPTPGCDSANLQVSFSGVSGNFNGNASNFVAALVNIAAEARAPDFIPGLHETYNSNFNVSACTATRNIQVSIFGVLGGLASRQSFPLVTASEGAGAIVFYGEEGAGGDRVWSSSAGTLFIDSVNGSVVTMRVVGAAMTMPAGAAAGSFTLDVSGQVNTFSRQP